MGYIKHHAIVVVGWEEKTDAAHAKAIEFGNTVSAVIAAPTNGYRTFLIAPDGSKEGWDNSDRGDAARTAFIEWATAWRYAAYVSWAEVVIGEDDDDAYVSRHAWEDGR